ncbi:alpha/beta hydrolase [Flavobacterium alkalisoli]|uniref:alpha/beta hydrolase n=1 Tax=Flavobacterium alkalisoli TaxID=2602769 RepID=UPI003A8EC91D
MKSFYLFISLLFVVSTKAQEVVPLYNGKILNSKPVPDKEQTFNDGILIISKVSVPTLTLYKPKKQSPKKTAVIICPGGGYEFLAAGHEGSDVATALNDMGVTAIILKYRLPSDSTMIDKTIGPLQDLQQAVKTVREKAKEWDIDPNNIGVMGFSAGGHLAASGVTQYKRELIDNPKHTSLRPDFSILLYPVISFTDSLTHMGSRNNLIGKNPSEELIKQYSNELQVTPDTPPAFLVHSADDGAVPIQNSIAYYEALLKNGVYGEMLLYPQGEHGFGLNNKSTDDKWIDNLKNWMKTMKFL